MMFDWSYLLIPVVLLPVIFLFAFTGCVLDREGRLALMHFNYDGGLHQTSGDAPALDSIEWRFVKVLKIDPGYNTGTIGGPNDPQIDGPHARGGDSGTAINATGESVSAGLDSRSYGDITCECTVVTAANPPFAPESQTIVLPPVTRHKAEDEAGPTFHLARNGNNFQLT